MISFLPSLSLFIFRAWYFFNSVTFWSPWKVLGLQSSTIWLCCFLVLLLLWCVFCQRKFTGTLAYLTGTVSHQALLRRNHCMLRGDFLHLSISPSLLHLRTPPRLTYKSLPLLLRGVASDPGLNSLVPGNSCALVLHLLIHVCSSLTLAVCGKSPCLHSQPCRYQVRNGWERFCSQDVITDTRQGRRSKISSNGKQHHCTFWEAFRGSTLKHVIYFPQCATENRSREINATY